jgi:hypothetical protein
MTAPQSFATHRVLPLPYIVCGVALLANACYLLYAMAGTRTCGAGLAAASGIALVVVWFKARRNAQIMQDRIIRLEMQVRLRLVLPAERHGEIARLTVPQLVALRFASDAELPELVRRTLAGELATQDAIKQAVREWQPDHLRV